MTSRLSIIIPVFKEQKIIRTALDHLLSLAFPGGMEIIVVDGEAQASTLDCLKSEAAMDSRILLLKALRGRGPQMNAGARTACGNIFLFLHADTRITQTGLDLIHTAFQSRGDWLFGAFDLNINCRRPIYRIIEAVISLRSRLTGIPYGDQAMFMGREVFEAVGGFPDIPIMEDVALMGKLKKTRKKPLIFRHTVSTSARRWESQGIVCTTLRNWALVSLFFLGIPPERLARYY
ncbi:MAG: TIGR04283 family arsenosugar biosynthesis glycosyltransferase [Pseudomonadota bacterium]